MRHEFSEVLNDGVDYFLLGDIQLLERFKQDQQLPDDLAYAFTHDDSGDQAVSEGVVLPLAGSITCRTAFCSPWTTTHQRCAKLAAA